MVKDSSSSAQPKPKLEENWHALSSQEILEQLATPPDQGLSAEEAARRLVEYGPNELVERGVHGVPAPGARVIALHVIGLDAGNGLAQDRFIGDEVIVCSGESVGDELRSGVIGMEFNDAEQRIGRFLIDQEHGGCLHVGDGAGHLKHAVSVIQHQESLELF
mgnify:CR=1 FL=1